MTRTTGARLLAAMFFSILMVASSWAQDESDPADPTVEESSEMSEALAIVNAFDRQTGRVELPGGFAALTVPEEYYFLNTADTNTILVDMWGNPPGDVNLGMLFPARYNGLEAESWGVIVSYEEDGYVSDEDAANIDYDDLLKGMQKDTREGNKARIDAGYGTVDLVGWAEPPHYDSTTKKLYWAKELAFEGTDQNTLNYDIRALGRKGVLSMRFVASIAQLDEINHSRSAVLAMADFNDGSKYSDFNPDIDKVAAYGIGALVAGKVASKAGLWAGLLLFLKKAYIFILIGLLAAGRWIKGLFTGKQQSSEGEST